MSMLQEIAANEAAARAAQRPVSVKRWGLVRRVEKREGEGGEVEEVELFDKRLRFRVLEADAYYALRQQVIEEGLPDDDQSAQSIRYFAELVAKSGHLADGEAPFDSPEGRAFLRDPNKTPFSLLKRLAEIALEVNGLGELLAS